MGDKKDPLLLWITAVDVTLAYIIFMAHREAVAYYEYECHTNELLLNRYS